MIAILITFIRQLMFIGDTAKARVSLPIDFASKNTATVITGTSVSIRRICKLFGHLVLSGALSMLMFKSF